MKNSFVKQFDQNSKFNYSCFDRVVLRGYIIRLFFAGGIAVPFCFAPLGSIRYQTA